MGWRNIISVGLLSAVVVFCSWQAAYAAVDLGVKAFQRGKCEEALKHPEPAANAGNKEATNYANKVGRFLSRDMQREARMMAIDWKKANDEKFPPQK